MKNEKALNVMEHIDADIIEEAENYTHKVKKNFWVGYVAIAACLCIVAGIAVPQVFDNKKPVPVQPSTLDQAMEKNESSSIVDSALGNTVDNIVIDIEQTQDAIVPTDVEDGREHPREEVVRPITGESGAMVKLEDNYYLKEMPEWGNKTVLKALDNILKDSPADRVVNILAKPYIDYDFVYEGKTLHKYYAEMCDERELTEKLLQLLKEGNSLKYGSALYEGGAPNGEKWDHNFYEQRMEFYGGDPFLSKYIIDGEFYPDKVLEDIEVAKSAKAVSLAYKMAFQAYYKDLSEKLNLVRPADVKAESGLILKMTPEEFKNFTADYIEVWTFSPYAEQPALK